MQVRFQNQPNLILIYTLLGLCRFVAISSSLPPFQIMCSYCYTMPTVGLPQDKLRAAKILGKDQILRIQQNIMLKIWIYLKNSSDSYLEVHTKWTDILVASDPIFATQKTHSIYVFLKEYPLICQAITCFQTDDWLVQYVSGSCLIFTSLFILKYSDLLKYSVTSAWTLDGSCWKRRRAFDWLLIK